MFILQFGNKYVLDFNHFTQQQQKLYKNKNKTIKYAKKI